MVKKMTDWFTSDLHLGHKAMWENHRKSFASLQEHDSTIMENLFQSTKAGDNLYILGDLFWKWSSAMQEQFFISFKKKRVNLHIILGNHDRRNYKFPSVVWTGQIKDIAIRGIPLTLCHYPLLVYNRSHYGAVLLHGHIHEGDSTWNKIKLSPLLEGYLGRSVNVNTELHDYKPLSFDQVMDLAAEKPDNFDLIKKGRKYNEVL